MVGGAVNRQKDGHRVAKHHHDSPLSSSTPVASTIATATEHEVPTLYPREISDTTPAICLSSEIAESIDGNTVDNGNNKRLCSFVFDILAEGDGNGLARARQPPAKQRIQDSPSPTGTSKV